ncbi:unnamed protein product [Spodoptera littoralis]|uniref:Uncharacterized protein n=1 Tax=Spodoptera littoralis TaxID=7109 RepID=A0A9P0N8E6_SPOLI|nr:unnamed protein product [Spodoptera littoralis]
MKSPICVTDVHLGQIL